MRSRFVLMAVFIVLSVQLALVPLVEVTGPASSLSPTLSAEAAAQGKEQTKKQRKRAAKNKKKQQQTKKKQQTKKAKQRKAKKNRNGERARGGAQAANLGSPSVPRLPGGPLRGAQRQVAQSRAQAQDPGERYIVVFANERADSMVLTTAIGAMPGVIPTNVYEHAVKGFAAYLTPKAKQELEQDPRVASVTEDRKRYRTVQRLPTGIYRIDAEHNPVAGIDGVDQRVDVDIAVIDTGIDFDHPDLNIFAYADCTFEPESEGWDLYGHGTHVAGTAAALDNNVGVVGVAPGARIWSLRVEDDFGAMFDSYIIECMDLVAEFADTPFNGQTIDVANMSLGGPYLEDRCGVGDPFNDAVCGMVDAGVTTVVSAGNESDDAAFYNPANIDQVITVSALADSDGRGGGIGGSFQDACTNPEQDDSLASFSNYGADVDIAAPGVGILSTFPTYIDQYCTPAAGVGYEVFPGTSMASPHVAGGAALLLAQNPNLTPAQVKASLLSSRENIAIPGDPDGINEGILKVGNDPGGPGSGDTTGPTLSIGGPGAAKVKQRVTLRVTTSDPSGIARVELQLCNPRCKVVAQDAAEPYSFVRKHAKPGRVTYKVRAYDTAGNVTEKVKKIRIKAAAKRKR